MPTIQELKTASKELAEAVSGRPTPEWLFLVADNASRKPEDWGFPQSFSRRPNWTPEDLRREISAVLWRLPTHPEKIPAVYRDLPFRALDVIAGGYIASLWRDAPSSRMRHAWLVECAYLRRRRDRRWHTYMEHPWAWYTRTCPVGDFFPRGREVAEWMLAKKGWVGWHRPLPVGYGPDGEMRTISPQNMLDEIWPEDLVNGSRTKPETVFRRVLGRKSEGAIEQMLKEKSPFPALPWSVVPGVEHISTPRRLVEESQRLANCSAGYASAIRESRCYLLSLPKSMAEITSYGEVHQHRGYRNGAPPPQDRALLDKWMSSKKEVSL